jgi:molecular chaperone HscC
LSDASLKLQDIESIILVGGATKLPLVRFFVSKLFGKLAYVNINPDEVVALGAGIQSALKNKSEQISEVILTDVCPYTLGTTVSVKKSQGFIESGHFLPIIERNTVIPVSKVERLYTASDNQKILNVDILQGESRLSKDNIFLGELNILVPPKSAGEEAIDIRFTYDINGILEVEVTVVSTGVKKSMVIEKDPGYMSKEEIADRFEVLSNIKVHPRENHENKLIIARGERLFEEKIGDVRQEIAALIREFEDALDKQDEKLIISERKRMKEIFDYIDTNGDF